MTEHILKFKRSSMLLNGFNLSHLLFQTRLIVKLGKETVINYCVTLNKPPKQSTNSVIRMVYLSVHELWLVEKDFFVHRLNSFMVNKSTVNRRKK